MLNFKLEERKAQNFLEHLLDGHFMHWVSTKLIIVYAILVGVHFSPDLMIKYGALISKSIEILLWVFAVEILLRIGASGVRFFTKWLDVLDFFVVFGALYFNFPELAVLRLIRVLRTFLMYRISPRMQHILYSLRHAFPGVVSVFCIVLVLFYIASVIGVALFKHPGIESFQSIGVTMKTLFQVLSGDDWFNVLRTVEKEFPWAWLYFFTFYIFMVFIFLNLFIGVIVTTLQNVEESLDTDENAETPSLEKELKDIKKELASLRKALNK